MNNISPAGDLISSDMTIHYEKQTCVSAKKKAKKILTHYSMLSFQLLVVKFSSTLGSRLKKEVL